MTTDCQLYGLHNIHSWENIIMTLTGSVTPSLLFLRIPGLLDPKGQLLLKSSYWILPSMDVLKTVLSKTVKEFQLGKKNFPEVFAHSLSFFQCELVTQFCLESCMYKGGKCFWQWQEIQRLNIRCRTLLLGWAWAAVMQGAVLKVAHTASCMGDAVWLHSITNEEVSHQWY